MRALVLAFAVFACSAVPSQAQNVPITGTWRGASVDPIGGPQQVEFVIQTNGTYSQQWRGRNNLNTYTGPWRAISEGVFRFDIVDWEPKEWCGPLGCTAILRPPGATVRIQFQGNNRFTVTPIGGGPTITYARAG